MYYIPGVPTWKQNQIIDNYLELQKNSRNCRRNASIEKHITDFAMKQALELNLNEIVCPFLLRTPIILEEIELEKAWGIWPLRQDEEIIPLVG